MPEVSFDVAEANRLHNDEGLSLNKIVRMDGMPKSVNTLSRHLRQGGYAVRDRRRAMDALDEQQLRHLYIGLGKSSYEIADMYGVTRSPVSRRLSKLGISRPPGWRLAGENNPIWKGGRTSTAGGYIYLLRRNHPMSGKNGYVLEHRLVMAEKLGRMLGDDEHVHHINGVKDDNRPENLAVVSGSDHKLLHVDVMRELRSLRERVRELEGLVGDERQAAG
jgi:hypothetical protein